MRKFVLSLLLGVSILFSGNLCFAAGGSAVMAGVWASESSSTEEYRTQSYISNITDSDITVSITYFKEDGTVYYGSSTTIPVTNAKSGTVSYPSSTGASVTFTLEANKTAINTYYKTSAFQYGYALIEWEQDSNVVYGLVVRAYNRYVNYPSGREAQMMSSVNGGKPF